MIIFFKKYRRQLVFITVLLVAWIAFLATSMPGDDSPVRYFRAMYFAATLFIFGALDIGFPQSESAFVLVVLWTCYFIAPAFTLSYVYTIIEDRLLNRLPFNLRKHTVLLGMGRTGTLLYETARRLNPAEKIVIIDRNLQNPNIPLYEKARSVWWLKRDFENEKVLREAKVDKAKQVLITTNNDLANIMAALNCLKINKGVEKILCHLQNYAMHEDFRKSLENMKEYEKIEVFNAYEIAAQEILQLINKKFQNRPGQGRIYVFLGFGHFGQTLYDDLVADGNVTEQDEIIIASLKKKILFDIRDYDWASDLPAIKCQLHPPVYENIYHAKTWDIINHMIAGKNKHVIIINCLDNDEENISLAVQIKKHGPEAMQDAIIYCRTFRPASKEFEMILEYGITETESQDIVPFSLEMAMRRAYEERLSENNRKKTL